MQAMKLSGQWERIRNKYCQEERTGAQAGPTTAQPTLAPEKEGAQEDGEATANRTVCAVSVGRLHRLFISKVCGGQMLLSDDPRPLSCTCCARFLYGHCASLTIINWVLLPSGGRCVTEIVEALLVRRPLASSM